MGVINNPVILSLMSVLEWISYRCADRLIGLSPGIIEGIAARGVDKSRIVMVPNGCDIDLFSGSSVLWRPEGVGGDKLLAIFTGTHGPANGLDAVLNAASELKRRGRSDIQIVFIGQGREKPRLQARASGENLDNVLFIDPLPKVQLTALMASADLGLQTLQNVPAFYYGTSPNKFFDYIAAGLPVLNNYPGWLAEMILDMNCGFVVPPDDPVAFADALIAAAEDRCALKQKGANALGLAETQFSRKLLANRWVEWVVGAGPES